MSGLTTAFLADPKVFVTAFLLLTGTPLGWCWKGNYILYYLAVFG